MTKYKIVFEGEEYDDIFDTRDEAEDYALYMCSCGREGAEELNMSNPGDYDYDENEEYEYYIIAVDV